MAKNNYVKTTTGKCIPINTRIVLSEVLCEYFARKPARQLGGSDSKLSHYTLSIPTSYGKTVLYNVGTYRTQNGKENVVLETVRYNDGSRLYDDGQTRNSWQQMCMSSMTSNQNISLSCVIQELFDTYSCWGMIDYIKLFGVKYDNLSVLNDAYLAWKNLVDRLSKNGGKMFYDNIDVTSVDIDRDSIKVTYEGFTHTKTVVLDYDTAIKTFTVKMPIKDLL